MKLFKRDRTDTGWKEYGGMLSGLYDAAGETRPEVGLFSAEPEAEIDEIIGLMKISSELGISPDHVVLITPHPTLDSLKMVAAEKYMRLIVASRPPDGNAREDFSIENILPTTCRLLHFRKGAGDPLSVCGAHNDRMVLSPGHMKNWCVTGYAHCPHYRMKHDE